MSNYAERVKTVSNKIEKEPRKAAEELRIIAKELENEAEETTEMKDYRRLLNKMKGKAGLNKFKIFIDMPRLRKPIRFWLDKLDKGEGAGAMDFNEMIQKMKKMIKMDLPAARFLKLLLDYGIAQGHVALNRILEKGRAKITLMKSEG